MISGYFGLPRLNKIPAPTPLACSFTSDLYHRNFSCTDIRRRLEKEQQNGFSYACDRCQRTHRLTDYACAIRILGCGPHHSQLCPPTHDSAYPTPCHLVNYEECSVHRPYCVVACYAVLLHTLECGRQQSSQSGIATSLVIESFTFGASCK